MRRALLGLFVVLAVSMPGCVETLLGGTGPEPSTWAFEMTGLTALAARGYTGAGVKVAIVDTGIDLGHPDLQGVKFGEWKDYVNKRTTPYDDEGHGTMVAGVIVANGLVKGGAPGVTLSMYKAIKGGEGEDRGSGRDADVGAAIDEAAAKGNHIICLSLGSSRNLLQLGAATAQAAERAVAKGILVVAAAGNEGKEAGTKDVSAPADVPGVIAVAAVAKDKTVAPFSNPGAPQGYIGATGLPGLPREDPDRKPEVAAPGVHILSTHLDGKYAYADGTSLATPFVAAGLALLLDAKDLWKGHDVEDMKVALMRSAEKAPGQKTPHDPKAGYGIFRADVALTKMA